MCCFIKSVSKLNFLSSFFDRRAHSPPQAKQNDDLLQSHKEKGAEAVRSTAGASDILYKHKKKAELAPRLTKRLTKLK